MRIRNIRNITLVISLLLHLLFLASYDNIRKILLFIPDDSLANQEIEKQLVFEIDEPKEIIETPDDAIQQVPKEKTNLLSDKNSIARDRYTAADKPEGAPYQQGDLDVHNIFENQDPVSSQESVVQQQSANEQNGRQQNPDNPAEPSQDLYALNQVSPPAFSRQALIGRQAQPRQRQQNEPLYKNEDFSARDIGGLAFNTYNWNFAPYMLHMKRRIQQNIFPPPAFTRMGMISGETRVRFKVMPNGEVKDLEVLSYKGHKSLMETSVRAIENSAAFDPLPADFPENYLEVTAAFSYYIMR